MTDKVLQQYQRRRKEDRLRAAQQAEFDVLEKLKAENTRLAHVVYLTPTEHEKLLAAMSVAGGTELGPWMRETCLQQAAILEAGN